jgi:hypothetical protein
LLSIMTRSDQGMVIASSTICDPVTDLVAAQMLTPSTVPFWSISESRQTLHVSASWTRG